jgi:hypothetical protein
MKHATISVHILALVSRGVRVPDAVDAVLGSGTYAKLASDVHEALRTAPRSQKVG